MFEQFALARIAPGTPLLFVISTENLNTTDYSKMMQFSKLYDKKIK